MDIRGSAEAQRLPNIIRKSLAAAYLPSTLNLFTHTSVLWKKGDYIQNIIVTEQNYLS